MQHLWMQAAIKNEGRRRRFFGGRQDLTNYHYSFYQSLYLFLEFFAKLQVSAITPSVKKNLQTWHIDLSQV